MEEAVKEVPSMTDVDNMLVCPSFNYDSVQHLTFEERLWKV